LPSKDQALPLQDIIENAADIADWTGGMDEAAFRKDRKTIRAVERCIQCICEAASKKLNDDVRLRIGDYPWRDMNDMGNQLRHGYDNISTKEVWKTAIRDIPAPGRGLPSSFG
jgi:uncharacterized protein with HEPN domain